MSSMIRKNIAMDLAANGGAGILGYSGALNYAAGSIGAFLHESCINVRNFPWLAAGDGITDDTAAIQAAANAATGRTLFLPGTSASYKITDDINLLSNTTVFGEGRGTVVKLAASNKNGFIASGKTNVIVRDLVILSDVVSTAAYIGGVNFYGSVKCRSINVECIGMSWAGVLINGSNYCQVSRCRFSAWLGNIQDAADICVYKNSNFNIITNNHCFGGGDHGIFIQDPVVGDTPTGNIVTANVVGEHKAYGIALYVTTAYDTRTVISNNVVSDILGTQLFGASGAGIFIQSGGGSVVTGNTVYNCCRSTTNFETLGMGGISAAIGEYESGTGVEIIISNNHVHALRGPGIHAVASNRGITIDGNTIKSTGTTAVRGEAILVSNVSAVRVTNNTIRHANPNYYALRVTAVNAEYSYHNIAGNTVVCANSAGGITVNEAGTGLQRNVIVHGNTVFGALSNPAYMFSKAPNLRFSDNLGESSGIVFSLANSAKSRLTGNRLASGSNTYSILFSGANTGSVADESNDFDGIVENDPASGVIISSYGSAPKAYGTGLWEVGDRVIQSVPIVGNPKGWRCTANGYPGTWVSEGNL